MNATLIGYIIGRRFVMAISDSGSYTDVMQHEAKAHGNEEFPAACYQVLFPETSVPAHWHTELELTHVIKGSLLLAVGGTMHVIETGQGAFLNQDVLHAAKSRNVNETTMLHTVIFHPKMIAPDQNSVFWKKYTDPLIENDQYPFQLLDPSVEWQKELLLHHEKAWSDIASEPDGYEMLARNELNLIVLLLCEHQITPKTDDLNNISVNLRAEQKRNRRNVKRMKAMVSFIRGHYFEPVKLDEIAAAGMVSRTECMRCFREVLDTTPVRFLNQYRLHVAAGYLRETDWTVSEIGYRCGYTEMGYFAAEFRKIYGMTPGEYRKAASDQSAEKLPGDGRTQ